MEMDDSPYVLSDAGVGNANITAEIAIRTESPPSDTWANRLDKEYVNQWCYVLLHGGHMMPKEPRISL